MNSQLFDCWVFYAYYVYTLYCLISKETIMLEGKKDKAGKKDSQLLIRINSSERNEFVSLCEELDTSAARELRKFIRSFIKKHKPVVSNPKE
jgi:hypothetical protein